MMSSTFLLTLLRVLRVSPPLCQTCRKSTKSMPNLSSIDVQSCRECSESVGPAGGLEFQSCPKSLILTLYAAGLYWGTMFSKKLHCKFTFGGKFTRATTKGIFKNTLTFCNRKCRLWLPGHLVAQFQIKLLSRNHFSEREPVSA